MLDRRHPSALALNLSESDGVAIYSITETLREAGVHGKADVIRGIFSGEGEHNGVPCKF